MDSLMRGEGEGRQASRHLEMKRPGQTYRSRKLAGQNALPGLSTIANELRHPCRRGGMHWYASAATGNYDGFLGSTGCCYGEPRKIQSWPCHGKSSQANNQSRLYIFVLCQLPVPISLTGTETLTPDQHKSVGSLRPVAQDRIHCYCRSFLGRVACLMSTTMNYNELQSFLPSGILPTFFFLL